MKLTDGFGTGVVEQKNKGEVITREGRRCYCDERQRLFEGFAEQQVLLIDYDIEERGVVENWPAVHRSDNQGRRSHSV